MSVVVVGFVALHASRLSLVDQRLRCIKGDLWNVKTSVFSHVDRNVAAQFWFEKSKTPLLKHLKLPQVFIYDPLYNWALSPLKALQRQQVCLFVVC